MLARTQLRAQLERMEPSLAATRRTLIAVERGISDRAEAETIRRRSKARHYHRRMSRWTGADEAEYRRILDDLLTISGPELDRLRRRAERQDTAIEVLRRKYGVNTERPQLLLMVAPRRQGRRSGSNAVLRVRGRRFAS